MDSGGVLGDIGRICSGAARRLVPVRCVSLSTDCSDGGKAAVPSVSVRIRQHGEASERPSLLKIAVPN